MRNEFHQDGPDSLKAIIGQALIRGVVTLGILIPIVALVDTGALMTSMAVALGSAACVSAVVLVAKFTFRLTGDWLNKMIPLTVILSYYVVLGTFIGMVIIVATTLISY